MDEEAADFDRGDLITLRDAATRWSANVGTADDVIRAAADAVARDLGGELLVRLAALSYGAYEFDFAEIVRAALSEVELPFHEPNSDEARMAVLRLMTIEVVQGGASARDLVRWAHQAIGHSGPAEAQELVDLDDCYDALEYIAETEDELAEKVIRAAARLARADKGNAR